MADDSTAPSTPVEAHEATLSGNESDDGKYGGKTLQEHADVSLNDYDPSSDKFKAADRVVTDYTTGASLNIKDASDGAPGLDTARLEADGGTPGVPADVKPAGTSTNNTNTSGSVAATSSGGTSGTPSSSSSTTTNR